MLEAVNERIRKKGGDLKIVIRMLEEMWTSWVLVDEEDVVREQDG